MKKIMIVISAILLLTDICFAAKGVNTKITARKLLQTDSSWDGSKLPHYSKGTPEVTVLKVVFPPGVKSVVHLHPVINAIVLLKGKLTVVTKDNKIKHFKAGDALAEVVNTWHYGENPGKVPAELIVFYAGVKEKPLNEYLSQKENANS